MKPKIDATKKYTSGGHPVEFLHRSPEGWPGIFPWKGIVGRHERTWTDNGTHYSETISNLDLIEVSEPLEVMVVVNCHGKPEALSSAAMAGWDSAFPSKAPHRLAKFREVIE